MASDKWAEEWSLADAQAWVRAHLKDGVICPCCTQHAKKYRRNINGRMVKALVNLYLGRNNNHDGFCHLPPIDPSGGEAARMVYWKLIEEARLVREDGGRAGWWRITDKGIDYLDNKISIPKYALVYDSVHYAFAGKQVRVGDAVRTRFDLRKLMGREPEATVTEIHRRRKTG